MANEKKYDIGLSFAGEDRKAVEAVLQGRVVEDHRWYERPRCLVLGKTRSGRRLLLWCDWPPREGLAIHHAFEPEKDHPVLSEYSDR